VFLLYVGNVASDDVFDVLVEFLFLYNWSIEKSVLYYFWGRLKSWEKLDDVFESNITDWEMPPWRTGLFYGGVRPRFPIVGTGLFNIFLFNSSSCFFIVAIYLYLFYLTD
jgi:hypothetical protein